jgi:hypothetical protein
MSKFLAGAAFLALAIVGLAGAAHAQGCTWMGNHWDCGNRYVYPKYYPHGTVVGDVTVTLEPYKMPGAPVAPPYYPPAPGYPPRLY